MDLLGGIAGNLWVSGALGASVILGLRCWYCARGVQGRWRRPGRASGRGLRFGFAGVVCWGGGDARVGRLYGRLSYDFWGLAVAVYWLLRLYFLALYMLDYLFLLSKHYFCHHTLASQHQKLHL